jgi:hypothetical protein
MTGLPSGRRSGVADALTGATLAVAVLALSGCAGDTVELNGKIFDWMGVSDSAKAAARREPRLEPRTGIVLPPDSARLPEPGSGTDVADINAQISDPDRKRAMAQAERERLHKAYCSGERNWKERALSKDDGKAPTSPFGPCSAFGAALKQD